MKLTALLVLTPLFLFVTAPARAAQITTKVVHSVTGNAQVDINFQSTTVNTFTAPECDTTPTPTPTPGDFKFPSCKSMLSTPGDVAHYTSGWHQIVGGPLLSGSDDVYSLGQNNYLQCFCLAEGTDGIQTNWLRTDTPVPGWFFVNGTQWNLGNFNYAAQNSDFKCQVTPTPKPEKTRHSTTIRHLLTTKQ